MRQTLSQYWFALSFTFSFLFPSTWFQWSIHSVIHCRFCILSYLTTVSFPCLVNPFSFFSSLVSSHFCPLPVASVLHDTSCPFHVTKGRRKSFNLFFSLILTASHPSLSYMWLLLVTDVSLSSSWVSPIMVSSYDVLLCDVSFSFSFYLFSLPLNTGFEPERKSYILFINRVFQGSAVFGGITVDEQQSW